MAADPLTLSLNTVIAASPMLGHKLEDRGRIRNAHDPSLVASFLKASTTPLGNSRQRSLFLVAPLDVLVVDASGHKQFHIIETNGTGIGGLTNMPVDEVATVLGGLTEMARDLPEPDALVLLGVSGLESSRNPRRNHLVHEKMLKAEALKRGFESKGGAARVFCMAQLADEPDALRTDQPTVVLGYIKEFLNHLRLEPDGRLSLLGRPVSAAVNDRFCLNVLSRFGHQVDLSRLRTMNRCFMAGADKGVAYELYNEYARGHFSPLCPDHIAFSRANNRLELIAGVADWLRRGQRVVIKAQGTGLGHGIEFFLDAAEPMDSVIGKIDHSIRVTEHYYGAVGGAFPYTLCEFVDTCTVPDADHALHGHKYELRVVVFRDGPNLKALPTIAKVSSEGYDSDKPARLSMINNVSTSAEARQREGTEYVLPLASAETLELLDIEPDHLGALSAFLRAGYVRHILDQVQDRPQRFGLPEFEGASERR